MTRTDILKKYRLLDAPDLIVEPQQAGIWRVRISAEGNPTNSIEIASARELSKELESIGETDLAARITKAADMAARYAKSP
jgi:hypothetical protein